MVDKSKVCINNCFINASKRGDLYAVKAAVDKGIDIDAKDEARNSELMLWLHIV